MDEEREEGEEGLVVQLLKAFRAQKWDAAREVCERLGPSLTFWLARSFGVPAERAEGIANDVLSEMFVRRDDVEDPKRGQGYVRTVLFRMVQSLRRAQKRARGRGELTEDIADPRSSATVEEMVATDDLFWSVYEVLDARQQTVFVLRYAGLTNEEIAQRLGLSVRTVKRAAAEIRRKAEPLIRPENETRPGR